MGSPFEIAGPALISFSGGRTSGFMLKQILDAHDGALPPDVHVAFANTGKERRETLQFVHECETRWSVPVHWVEWRATPARAAGTATLRKWLEENDHDGRMVSDVGFDRVGFNSASRFGEPFEALIAMKQRLPNWRERWCTEFLKVGPITALAASFGWAAGSYLEVLGLRHDEGMRILRSLDNANFRWDRKSKQQVPRDPPRRLAHPLSIARITRGDVLAYWKQQDFDLNLKPHEGNCDLCFMKGRGLRKRIIRDTPWVPEWWRDQEDGGQFFDRRNRVSALIDEVRRQPEFVELDDDEHDVECGTHCPDLVEEEAAA